LEIFVLIKDGQTQRLDKLFPYALFYFPIAISYAFIINELPLRGFSIDPIYDSPNSTNLGSQSINQEGVIAVAITIASTLVNILVWLFSLFIIVRHFVRKQKIR
jgi:hypothetical protein